jgi:hypothetical protein
MFFHKWYYMALCMITLVSCTPTTTTPTTPTASPQGTG